jgi:UDP-N-acetyl-D-mannosaminuronic acid transferase (WecB/TagA/CpsF family)
MSLEFSDFNIEKLPRLTLFLNHFSLRIIIENDFIDALSAACQSHELKINIHADGGLLVRHLALYSRFVKRYSFDWSSIAGDLLKRWNTSKSEVYFIGGSEKESLLFNEKITLAYPDIVLRCHNGFESKFRILQILSQLSRPAYVVLGLGSPVQEFEALKLAKSNPNLIIFTCGGFITQTAKFDDIYGGFWRILPRFLTRCVRQPFVLRRVIFSYPKALLIINSWLKLTKNTKISNA